MQGEYEEADALLSEAIEAADDMSELEDFTLATWLLNRAGVLAAQVCVGQPRSCSHKAVSLSRRFRKVFMHVIPRVVGAYVWL